MTNKEALEIFEKAIRCNSDDDCPPVACDECPYSVTTEQFDDAFQVALEALQEPKQPDHIVGASKKDVPSVQPEIIRCKECIYYDSPHVENNGERIEYSEMPEDAFDVLGVGLVSSEYGINIGGRCLRDYNAGYSEDKRVFVSETNYCGRAKRRTDGRD